MPGIGDFAQSLNFVNALQKNKEADSWSRPSESKKAGCCNPEPWKRDRAAKRICWFCLPHDLLWWFSAGYTSPAFLGFHRIFWIPKPPRSDEEPRVGSNRLFVLGLARPRRRANYTDYTRSRNFFMI